MHDVTLKSPAEESMNKETITYILVIGIIVSLVALGWNMGSMRYLANHQYYEPDQPIAYSHRLHAGELLIDCQYCHYGAERSRYAGIPAASVCMNCHSFVTAPFGAIRAEDKLATEENRDPKPITSPELAKLYTAMGLDANLNSDPDIEPAPLEWMRVHQLPDYAYFDHRPHVKIGVLCQTCHGPVETMERMRQSETLRMGWCVNCHREANNIGVAGKQVSAPLDCVVCHL